MSEAIVLVAAAACGMMFLTWLAARWLDNAGIVDIVWSYSFAVVAGLLLWRAGSPTLPAVVLAAAVIIWSLRLGTHLLVRVARHHPEEDRRYAALRQQFPRRPWLMMLVFFQLQAVLVVLLAAPFLVVVMDTGRVMLGWTGVAGLILWIVGVGGEALADRQLNRFRSNPANRGKTCREGLWRYSRHPNYFFEWVVWVGYFVFALGSPWGWISVYCPLLMLWFLLRVTGVPPAEARSLEARGEEYADYQRTTSVFIPWKPKSLP